MSEEKVYPVSAEAASHAYIDDAKYQEMYKRSIDDPEGFWAEQADEFLDWFKKWDKVMEYDYHKADITPRQTAMLDFAMKVSNDAKSISEADFDILRGHGFDDEDIWDIAGITAFFGLSNRMANFTSMRPNSEFYAMARG